MTKKKLSCPLNLALSPRLIIFAIRQSESSKILLKKNKPSNRCLGFLQMQNNLKKLPWGIMKTSTIKSFQTLPLSKPRSSLPHKTRLFYFFKCISTICPSPFEITSMIANWSSIPRAESSWEWLKSPKTSFYLMPSSTLSIFSKLFTRDLGATCLISHTKYGKKWIDNIKDSLDW